MLISGYKNLESFLQLCTPKIKSSSIFSHTAIFTSYFRDPIPV